MSRRRIFSKENTFWAFFSQVLDADGGCQEVIRKLQSYASLKGVKVPSSSTASYCTARKKLDEQMLSDILAHTAERLEQMPESGLLNGDEGVREMKVSGLHIDSQMDIETKVSRCRPDTFIAQDSRIRSALLVGKGYLSQKSR